MPDARVQAAIANWGPRLIANGIDYNDFVRVTATLEHWDDWLEAWCAAAEVHRSLAVEARARGHARSAGEAFARAAVCFHFAKFVWVIDPERNQLATVNAVAALREAHALLDPTAERIVAPLDGATVVANLRRPTITGPAVPLVVLIPGLDSTKEEFFRWEAVFLSRGMATLSLDGPGQGETGFALHIRHDYEAAVTAILDVVAQRPELDAERVGAVGVSLGGYYVMRAAAFEPRLLAVAGVSGPYNAAAQWDAMPSLTREAFIHHTGSESAQEGRERAAALDLDGVAQLVRQPCLVVTGRRDRVIPWEQTKRIADAAPHSEWVLYDEGTHVCNNIPFKYRPLVAYWMRDQLE